MGKNPFYFQIVIEEYAQSFRDVMAFENSNPKDINVLTEFAETLVKIRDRHTNTVIMMAEAVMELKLNAVKNGVING